jgi:hypothetical protein
MDKYRIIKQGKDLWVIIEPKRMLTLYDENNKLLSFKTKEAALKYCEEKNYGVSEDYR